jgi:CubicO group peptidase (beta-lactamase class C family)
MSLEEARRPIERYLAEQVARSRFPGASYRLVRADGPVLGGQVGLARRRPQPAALRPDAVYDVASLTKPVITATVALLLAERGQLDPAEPVRSSVPEAIWPGEPRIEDLLLHTSGLPAWRPLYQAADPLHALFRTPLEREPRGTAVYSCLGYVLLGLVLERRSGRSLRQLGRELVFEPLGMRRSGFSGELPDAVPTELDVPPGQVHDANARALGGMPGNAGLFSTAQDLGLYASALLASLAGRPGLLSPESARQMAQPRAEGRDEARSVGWMVQGRFRTSGGDAMGPRAFGHTGFTGCSLFFDPRREIAAILLTNRVHPREAPTPMFEIRRRFHDLCCAAADALESQRLLEPPFRAG